MAEARQREAWSHTSQLLAMTANVHRDVKKKPRPYSPKDFNPLVKRRTQPPPKADIHVLKQVFVDGR